MRHLVEILRDNRDEQISFKFAISGVLTHETMVFNRADLYGCDRQNPRGERHPLSVLTGPAHRLGGGANRIKVRASKLLWTNALAGYPTAERRRELC